jgi:hypothetical protein
LNLHPGEVHPQQVVHAPIAEAPARMGDLADHLGRAQGSRGHRNALVAVEDVPTVEPSGPTCRRLDTARLAAVFGLQSVAVRPRG